MKTSINNIYIYIYKMVIDQEWGGHEEEERMIWIVRRDWGKGTNRRGTTVSTPR